ncbi:Bug family tripartite tricarboxylate transporter substrate binding protein [Pelosinus propionicus]|uniref:Tripartite-type tricarboxylate transporter, receptor component TctC n=1 Tax=Pelosinus propionicus DSM 13327 TaxID=1123291 RepID=A0A1I4NWD9_9FIRM|nr:tripartite tricarboxylate transporter substrate binding protein [Pelosinus propionicus]SFM19725.1 Tripartite-type tricarboxylate transporter, receptor component TctC [Pelosinus propionicus DSM 13327]
MENKAVTSKKSYPDKPITLIVPFGVGGGMDLVARLLEKSAPTHLGQPLIITNKPGGAGTVGWNELASANPDGYTLGMTGVEVILQPLYGTTKYNYPTALDPLVQIADLSIVMVVRTQDPWQNITDLISYAKQHPGEIKFGHGGIGTIGHVTGETFAKAANIHLEQVPYQSAAEAMASLLGGHVQVAFLNPASVKEQMKNGMVKAFAVATDQRLVEQNFTDIPTFKEQGLEVVCTNWYTIAAPKDLPNEVKVKLTEGFKVMINDPEFKNNMNKLGLQVTYLGPTESAEKWISENRKLSVTVQETGILEKIKSQKK